MSAITNPILRGFNPDPAIIRVGEDYFVATSTFEWYPGVQIHTSRDLENWSLVSRPLNEQRLLDLRGVPDSCGVWAPCLTHADGKFWLIYTVVRRFDGDYKDTHNYLTTAENIEGPWTDPVYLNSSGFDPSLYHEDDGTKWLVNMVWDNRPDRTFFGGIMLQQYSVEEQKLVGERKNIFAGSELGFTEGPHVYKINNQYYLMTAEGGTGYDHAVTISRSDQLQGPYELDPNDHVITHKDDPSAIFQRTGHGSLVDTPNGDWYIAHLASRPYSNNRRFSPMGRESVLQKVSLNDDGWFTLSTDEQMSFNSGFATQATYDFSEPKLHEDFQWLRTPDASRIFDVDPENGVLKLIGREAIGSSFEQALVARRQETFDYVAETRVRFSPDCYQQLAGITAYYNAHKFHYLYLSADDDGSRHLGIMSCAGDQSLSANYPIIDNPVRVDPSVEWVDMRIDVNAGQLQFSYRFDPDAEWTSIGPKLDALILSDEAGKGEGANFTGAFVGMAAQDVSGRSAVAEFSSFRYEGSDQHVMYRKASEYDQESNVVAVGK